MPLPILRVRRPSVLVFLCLGLWLTASPATVRAQDDGKTLEQWTQRARKALPKTAAECRDAPRVESVAKAARELEDWAERVGTAPRNAILEEVLRRVELLMEGQAQVDRLLDDLFALRKEFVKEADSEQRRLALRNYLRMSNDWLDLSGRVRYQSEDTITDAAFRVAAHPPTREKLIDLLVRHNSAVGADVMSWALIDPPANAANGARPASVAAKRRILQLIARSGSLEVVPLLARFLREERRYPELTVAAADALRQVGFPQDVRPGDTDMRSQPPITAAQVLPLLEQLPSTTLDSETARLRSEVIQWLKERKEQGLVGDSYRIGNCEVRPGDWMLVRNSSPYNRLTDLAPGLFTHVAVVTDEKASDGRRRMVVTDLTVRETHIRTSNMDVFVRQYRNYLFLRHPDAATARTMADVARSIIGCESVFDLNYRIENVVALKGQPKQGKVIHSYCAGLLLLCGQETSLERSRLFPVSERVADGKTAKNFKELGVSFGDQFVSPTGPLFSGEFTIAGRRPPMYDPAIEVEEAIYDHFAVCIRKFDLSDKRDTYQKIRVSLAEAAKGNPALARLLAQLNNVNPATDLVAAAKAAAVVDELDRAAEGNGRKYVDAFFAVTYGGPLESLKGEGYSAEEIQRLQQLRQQHADLHRQLMAGQLNPRAVRKALVAYYVRHGKSEIEVRFKTEPDASGAKPR